MSNIITDIEELKKIKIEVICNTSSTELSDKAIECDIINFTDISIKRRYGEGIKPIFDRSDVIVNIYKEIMDNLHDISTNKNRAEHTTRIQSPSSKSTRRVLEESEEDILKDREKYGECSKQNLSYKKRSYSTTPNKSFMKKCDKTRRAKGRSYSRSPSIIVANLVQKYLDTNQTLHDEMKKHTHGKSSLKLYKNKDSCTRRSRKDSFEHRQSRNRSSSSFSSQSYDTFVNYSRKGSVSLRKQSNKRNRSESTQSDSLRDKYDGSYRNRKRSRKYSRSSIPKRHQKYSSSPSTKQTGKFLNNPKPNGYYSKSSKQTGKNSVGPKQTYSKNTDTKWNQTYYNSPGKQRKSHSPSFFDIRSTSSFSSRDSIREYTKYLEKYDDFKSTEYNRSSHKKSKKGCDCEDCRRNSMKHKHKSKRQSSYSKDHYSEVMTTEEDDVEMRYHRYNAAMYAVSVILEIFRGHNIT